MQLQKVWNCSSWLPTNSNFTWFLSLLFSSICGLGLFPGKSSTHFHYSLTSTSKLIWLRSLFKSLHLRLRGFFLSMLVAFSSIWSKLGSFEMFKSCAKKKLNFCQWLIYARFSRWSQPVYFCYQSVGCIGFMFEYPSLPGGQIPR